MINFQEYFPEMDSQKLLTAISSYFGQNRYYHNFDHIMYMLNLYDQYIDELFEKDDRKAYLLRYAILYHDTYYDVSSKNNEIQSVAMFLSDFSPELYKKQDNSLLGMLAPAAKSKEVFTQDEKDFIVRMIMATANHFEKRNFYKDTPDAPYVNFIIDLDFAAMGDDYEVFERNNANITAEYLSNPENNVTTVSNGREAFLHQMLNLDENVFRYLYAREDIMKQNIKKFLGV